MIRKNRSNLAEVMNLTRAGRLGEALSLLKTRTPPAAAQAASKAKSAVNPATLLESLKAKLPAGKFSLPEAVVSRLRVRRAAELHSGASFEPRSYSGAEGRLDYKLYVPAVYRGQALPLIVMLHGCKQNPDDFAAGTQMNVVAEERGLLVAYPAQSSSANPSHCWNWFEAAHQGRDKGEPALIAAIIRSIGNEFRVDSRRI